MAKQDQVLIIEPQHELSFVGPFTTAVSAVMSLTNPSDRKVCFKIKTTAPKRYCVKPNSGVIDAKQEIQLVVTALPFEHDPYEKNRQKFMVQTMFAPQGEINQDTLWKEANGQLMNHKLNCVFVLPTIQDLKDGNRAFTYGAKNPINANDMPDFKSSIPTSESSNSTMSCMVYMYAALIFLAIGIIMGKWFI